MNIADNNQLEISDLSVMRIKPLISVLMLTYNHEQFIGNSIEGVVSQKTDFPIELIIGEDCSKDNTRAIVLEYQRKYPHVIRVIYSDRNVGMKKNNDRIHLAVRGEYIAYCEGDDGWIDDRKLQKQVDMMNKRPNCSLVFHAAKILNARNGRTHIRTNGSKIKMFSLDEVLLAHPRLMTTASMLARRSMIDPEPKWMIECEVGDYPFSVHCASRGEVIYLPEVMSLYRKGIPNSWTEKTLEIEPRIKILDSILWSLSEFLKENGNSARESVLKAQRKFIMAWLYLAKNMRPSMVEPYASKYEPYLTWKEKMLIGLTRWYLPRRVAKLTFETKEYLSRRFSGEKVIAG